MVESKALVENFQNQTSYILLYDNNEIDNEEHFLLGFVEPFNIDNSSHHQLLHAPTSHNVSKMETQPRLFRTYVKFLKPYSRREQLRVHALKLKL